MLCVFSGGALIFADHILVSHLSSFQLNFGRDNTRYWVTGDFRVEQQVFVLVDFVTARRPLGARISLRSNHEDVKW